MKNKNLELFAKMLAEEIKDTSKIQIIEEPITYNSVSNYASQLSSTPISENSIEKVRWNDPLSDQKFVTAKEMQEHYNLFLSRIQQQLSSIGGGGEVNFRYLDDTNRATMTQTNDNWVL